VQQADHEWERWPDDQADRRGDAEWKTLISAGVTQSEALTVGIARLPANGALRPHRHHQPGAYLVLEGTGVVTIDVSYTRGEQLLALGVDALIANIPLAFTPPVPSDRAGPQSSPAIQPIRTTKPPTATTVHTASAAQWT
jgi:hypothetical protein